MEITPVTVFTLTGKFGAGKTTKLVEILTINNNNGNLIYNGSLTPVITSESYKHIDDLIEPILKKKKVDYVYLKGLTQLCKKAQREQEKVNFLYSIGIRTKNIHETYLRCKDPKCPYRIQNSDLDPKDKIIITVNNYALNKEFFRRLYIGIDEIDGLFVEDKETHISDTEEGEFSNNSTDLFNGWRKVKPEAHNKWQSEYSKLIDNKDYKWLSNNRRKIEYALRKANLAVFRIEWEDEDTEYEVINLMTPPKIYNLLKLLKGTPGSVVFLASALLGESESYRKKLEEYATLTGVKLDIEDVSVKRKIPPINVTVLNDESRSYSKSKIVDEYIRKKHLYSAAIEPIFSVKEIDDVLQQGKKVAVITFKALADIAQVKETNIRRKDKIAFPKSQFLFYSFGNKMNGQNLQDESYNLGLIIVYGDYVRGDVANDYEEYTQVNKWGWELNPKTPNGKSKEAYKKILEEAYKKVLEEPIQALSRGRGKIPTYYIGNLLTSGSEKQSEIKRKILLQENISISHKFI